MTVSEYPTKTVQVLLSCRHTVDLRLPEPEQGAEVWCFRCRVYSFAGLINRVEWESRCFTCHFKRRHGQDKYLAIRSANRHAERTGHDATYNRLGLRPGQT